MSRRAREQDFEAFASEAWSRLRHAGWLLTGHDHDAEDLASIALAKTYAAWSRVRRDDAYAYARKCMVNANIDRHRKRKVSEIVTDDLPETPYENVRADLVAEREHLAQLLELLSPKERRIVVLRYFFDRSEAEVATELGISLGTVKSTSSRALAKMRVSAEMERFGPDAAGAAGEGLSR